MREEMMNTAKQMLAEKSERTCVVVWEGEEKEAYVSRQKGIRPLMELLAVEKEPFRGGVIADKVFGRAAAFLAVYGKAEAVYANIISETAYSLLKEAGIPCEYVKIVPYIINRAKTGKCPMEEAVWNIDDCEEAYLILKQKIS